MLLRLPNTLSDVFSLFVFNWYLRVQHGELLEGVSNRYTGMTAPCVLNGCRYPLFSLGFFLCLSPWFHGVASFASIHVHFASFVVP